MKSIQKYLQAFKDMAVSSDISISGSISEPLILVVLFNSDGLSKADLGEKIYYSRTSHKSGLDRPLKNLITEKLIEKQINENSARKNGEAGFYYYITKKGRELISDL